MKLTDGIQSRWIIHAKGALFLALGALSSAMLLAQVPNLKTAALLAVSIWAFCRFYYYFFYVLERYLGRERRFAGMLDALRFLLSKPKPSDPKA